MLLFLIWEAYFTPLKETLEVERVLCISQTAENLEQVHVFNEKIIHNQRTYWMIIPMAFLMELNWRCFFSVSSTLQCLVQFTLQHQNQVRACGLAPPPAQVLELSLSCLKDGNDLIPADLWIRERPSWDKNPYIPYMSFLGAPDSRPQTFKPKLLAHVPLDH